MDWILKKDHISLLGYFYLAVVIATGISFGFSLSAYIVLAILAFIFISLDFPLGLKTIIFLTFIFERYFTLEPLQMGLGEYKIYPLDIVITITMTVWFLQKIIKKEKLNLPWELPEKILVLFVILNFAYFIASFFAENFKAEVSFSTLKNYALYPVLYFLTIATLESFQKTKNLFRFTIYCAIGIIVFIIIGFWRGEGLWTQFTPLSTPGTRYLAGTHAFYILMAFLLLLSYLVFSVKKNRLWLKGALLWIWSLGILVSLMRHLWLALAFSLVLLFFLIPKENKKIFFNFARKNIAILIILLAIFLLFMNLTGNETFFNFAYSATSNFGERIFSLTHPSDDSSASWRIALWQSAFSAWKGGPILGLGFGKSIFLQIGDWQKWEEIRNIHSSPLAILMQMGIAGLLVFATFIGSVVKKSWKYIKNNLEMRPYYTGFLMALIALLFSSFFQPYFETNLTGIFLWILLGAIRTAGLIPQKQENEDSSNQQIFLS